MIVFFALGNNARTPPALPSHVLSVHQGNGDSFDQRTQGTASKKVRRSEEKTVSRKATEIAEKKHRVSKGRKCSRPCLPISALSHFG